MESTFLTAAYIVLRFGSAAAMVLITHQCFGYHRAAPAACQGSLFLLTHTVPTANRWGIGKRLEGVGWNSWPGLVEGIISCHPPSSLAIKTGVEVFLLLFTRLLLFKIGWANFPHVESGEPIPFAFLVSFPLLLPTFLHLLHHFYLKPWIFSLLPLFLHSVPTVWGGRDAEPLGVLGCCTGWTYSKSYRKPMPGYCTTYFLVSDVKPATSIQRLQDSIISVLIYMALKIQVAKL